MAMRSALLALPLRGGGARVRSRSTLVGPRWHAAVAAGRRRSGARATSTSGAGAFSTASTHASTHASTTAATAPSSAPPDSFHGISLPREDDGGQRRERAPSSGDDDDDASVREAEVVRSDEERARTRASIEESVRAAMAAHRRASAVAVAAAGDAEGEEDGGEVGRKRDDVVAREGASRATEEDGAPPPSGPYERLLRRLEAAEEAHALLDESRDRTSHLRGCAEIGDLHYRLGRMEASHAWHEAALRGALDAAAEDDEDGTTGSEEIVAGSAHALGAISARCGDYDEARRWYDEALARKRRIVEAAEAAADDEGGASSSSSARHELGKTLNAAAALEVLRGGGGNAWWDEALSLFREAERCYLHGCAEEAEVRGDALEEFHEISFEAIRRMDPGRVESVVDVRSNVGELLRRRGDYKEAMDAYRSALEVATSALACSYDRAARETGADESLDNGPSLDEQRNTIVDLLVKIADTLLVSARFDDAAAAYEQALIRHVSFRRPDERRGRAELEGGDDPNLPVAATSKVPAFDPTSATAMEAAIRKNLAYALAQVGRDRLALEHYEASLAVARTTGGDFHPEVAHTLMRMGAVLGGPLREWTRALVCFKEALFVYRKNLEEQGRADADGGGFGARGGRGSAPSDDDGLFGDADDDDDDYERHVQNAMKNIGLIEAAVLKDSDGARGKMRR